MPIHIIWIEVMMTTAEYADAVNRLVFHFLQESPHVSWENDIICVRTSVGPLNIIRLRSDTPMPSLSFVSDLGQIAADIGVHLAPPQRISVECARLGAPSADRSQEKEAMHADYRRHEFPAVFFGSDHRMLGG